MNATQVSDFDTQAHVAHVVGLMRAHDSATHVTRMRSIDADTELKLKDGTVKVNSSVLKVFSSVLQSALEADGVGGSNCNNSPSAYASVSVGRGSSKLFQVSVEAITHDEWDVAAPFWLPVPVKSALNITYWWQVKVVLKVGSLLDIQPLMAKADECIEQHVSELQWDDEDDCSVWEWLHLADNHCIRAYTLWCNTFTVLRLPATLDSGCADVAGSFTFGIDITGDDLCKWGEDWSGWLNSRPALKSLAD